MEPHLSISSALALFAALTALAAVPSTSVVIVCARSVSTGFGHGVLATVGVVLGDMIFILLAAFGLALLIEAMGSAFILIKYAGGLYLLWLSARTWRAKGRLARAPQNENDGSRLSSFMAGLLITLGDQKAILFYLGFLPAFLDVSMLSIADIVIIASMVVVAVGGVKLAYAYAAGHAARVLGGRFSRVMHLLAAIVLCMAGLWMIIRA